jgi:hypothetical protein
LCKNSHLDLSEILDDWEGEREARREVREDEAVVLLSICSTLEKISELQSEPILLLRRETRNH